MFPTGDSPAVVKSVAGLVSLLAAVVFFLCLGATLLGLAKGEAKYKAHRFAASETVTRQEAPEKFATAINQQWMMVGGSAVFCVVGYAFYRKIQI